MTQSQPILQDISFGQKADDGEAVFVNGNTQKEPDDPRVSQSDHQFLDMGVTDEQSPGGPAPSIEEAVRIEYHFNILKIPKKSVTELPGEPVEVKLVRPKTVDKKVQTDAHKSKKVRPTGTPEAKLKSKSKAKIIKRDEITQTNLLDGLDEDPPSFKGPFEPKVFKKKEGQALSSLEVVEVSGGPVPSVQLNHKQSKKEALIKKEPETMVRETKETDFSIDRKQRKIALLLKLEELKRELPTPHPVSTVSPRPGREIRPTEVQKSMRTSNGPQPRPSQRLIQIPNDDRHSPSSHHHSKTSEIVGEDLPESARQLSRSHENQKVTKISAKKGNQKTDNVGENGGVTSTSKLPDVFPGKPKRQRSKPKKELMNVKEPFVANDLSSVSILQSQRNSMESNLAQSLQKLSIQLSASRDPQREALRQQRRLDLGRLGLQWGSTSKRSELKKEFEEGVDALEAQRQRKNSSKMKGGRPVLKTPLSDNSNPPVPSSSEYFNGITSSVLWENSVSVGLKSVN